MTYHIRATARNTYDVPQSFVNDVGAVRFPGSEEVRRLEYLMRRGRAAPGAPGATAGGLVALGVLNEVHRHLLRLYRSSSPADPFAEALRHLAGSLGAQAAAGSFDAYVRLFPPPRPDVSLDPARQPDLLGELVLLSVVNRNPACSLYAELFSDAELRSASRYDAVVSGLESWSSAGHEALGWGRGIVDLLMAPIRHAPDSLLRQLEYVRERWGGLLGPLLRDLLLAIGVLKEEQKLRFTGGPLGPAPLPSYGAPGDEPERYTADRGWMPRLVLIAKHTLVWLHQLSEKHGRPIRRIDEIPDAELDALAAAGFTGLWLIGIWRRSRASETIKHRCGNPEAAGSAYAIVDYTVDPDLGGDEAARVLSERCASRGIRLGCDMVPNHTALDARWVADRPDWYVQTPAPPFPAYRFLSEDVAGDGRVSVKLEDHYYDRSDAAVVFQRRDSRSGDVRYLYHGNDGTSTPWNDTAQLDFLRPEVRDAVADQILSVARGFSIIRFDAAMVLTRKHFQRLWYPPPGSGGDIPSRAERGLDPAEFDRRMPAEFWRTIVDRVAEQAPDTLLLAEAFWLLEGYFVRTLGMHRVYNSAFMNMLKAEENSRYRQLIKSTLEYDPEILKRYVNFMSNPDEEPAAVQFGTGDKYFGIAVMMATLPGLPMFGHGQIEGLSEKYGMEYRRSYRPEAPNQWVVDRHSREIFPLLRLRPLFAEADFFRLFDLYGSDGAVNENVFAYTNRRDAACALVVYNNSAAPADGWLTVSAAFRDRARGNVLIRRRLGEEIGLADDPASYCVFRDASSGLEYIRPSAAVLSQGLRVVLGPFAYNVFLDFREVRDNRLGHYTRLAADLGGAGLPSVEQGLRAYLAPAREALGRLAACAPGRELPGALRDFLDAVLVCFRGRPSASAAAPDWARRLSAGFAPLIRSRASRGLAVHVRQRPWLLTVLGAAEAVSAAGRELDVTGAELTAELRLPEAFRDAALERGLDAAQADRGAALLGLVAGTNGGLDGLALAALDPATIAGDERLQAFLGVNWFDGVEWLRQEPLEDLMLLLQIACMGGGLHPNAARRRAAERLLRLAAAAGYRADGIAGAGSRTGGPV